MATIITRSGKGTPLTHAEMDANWNNLNNDKLDAVAGGTASAFLSLHGGVSIGSLATKSADFTVAASEAWIVCNGAGALTATLPAAASYPYRILGFNNATPQAISSASANVLPVTGGAPGTEILAATDGAWAILVSDGTNWRKVAAG